VQKYNFKNIKTITQDFKKLRSRCHYRWDMLYSRKHDHSRTPVPAELHITNTHIQQN